MKKIFFTVLAMGSFALSVNAQSTYDKAIGLHFGLGYINSVDVSYKQFISKASAIEINAGLVPNAVKLGLGASAAYQYHFPTGRIPGFRPYIGGGLSLSQTAFNEFHTYDDMATMTTVFAIGGIDYKVKDIPLNLSFDLRPGLFIMRNARGSGYGNYTNINISVRYAF